MFKSRFCYFRKISMISCVKYCLLKLCLSSYHRLLVISKAIGKLILPTSYHHTRWMSWNGNCGKLSAHWPMNCLLSLFYDAYFLKGKKYKYKNTLVSFQCRLTRQVSHVEQEPLTLPEHMGSTPGFNGFNVARFLAFCVMFCRSSFIHLFFTIVLPILLWFTVSDCPFVIFKLFIENRSHKPAILQ